VGGGHHREEIPQNESGRWLIDCYGLYIFTGEDDWNVVFDKCSPLASKWQQLSAYLGLKLSIINRIRSDFPNDSLGCWSEALKEWIGVNYDTQRFGKPSWKTLLKAVAKTDMLHFRRLASEHQGTAAEML
jgi:hypothetical protein